MRKWSIISTLLLLLCSSANADDNSFAIVELYTSQGCSSCPPADSNLLNINERARANNERIFPLSFHVDYWDYIGWKDPYSKPEYSNRQRRYARHLKSSSVYTPQMIINGKHGFVGSRTTEAKLEINKALNEANPVNLNIQLSESTGSQIKVQYTCDSVPTASTINFAIVERVPNNYIERGENRGRTLRHANVVRSLVTNNLTEKSGALTLNVPSQIDLSKASIVGFIQHNSNMHILSADLADLSATL